MRRGLMGWSEEELPVVTLNERTWRLQAAMRREGLDGMLFYTNLVRPSAVTYLTGFTPYWSDGILLLPRSGEPVFATALSKRVANWIKSTNPTSELINTPKPGAAIGKRLSDGDAKRVGILELDSLPSGLYDEITGAAPAVFITDAGTLFGDSRRTVDPAEHNLLQRANAIARDALELIDAAVAADAGEIAGIVEKHARLAGLQGLLDQADAHFRQGCRRHPRRLPRQCLARPDRVHAEFPVAVCEPACHPDQEASRR